MIRLAFLVSDKAFGERIRCLQRDKNEEENYSTDRKVCSCSIPHHRLYTIDNSKYLHYGLVLFK
jgi:hypothetical protein